MVVSSNICFTCTSRALCVTASCLYATVKQLLYAKVVMCQVNLTALCRKAEIHLLVRDWFVSVARKPSFRSEMNHGMFKNNRNFRSSFVKDFVFKNH